MKFMHFFSVLWISTIMIMLAACDMADYKQQKGVTDTAIGLRSCPVTCPIGDCCCFVELQNPESEEADLDLCGTSNGSDGCSGSSVGSCASFEGGYQHFELDVFNPRVGFCMGKNSPFWIENTSTSDDANIYLSCQGGIVSPQILTITIPAQSRWYYETDGDCELATCQ